MNYEHRKYIIIDSSEVGTIDFTQVNETSVSTLRYSLDDSQTFVKFDGETPNFLDGKREYNHHEMIGILQSKDWTEEEE